MESNTFSPYERNEYSQFGEDGVVSEILSRIAKSNSLDKWCVEFGAWDGVYLSNTCNLIRNDGYSAVLIEGDAKKFAQLKSNLPQDNVYKICKFVSFEGENTLENILADTPIPKEFDFLSIDIDGVDYYILEGLNKYYPKVICIEFNPTIPNVVDFIQSKDFSIKQGASAKAINRLANEKGYVLLAVTGVNLIFVRKDFANLCVTSLLSLEELNTQGNDPQYLFVGYDGTIISNKQEIPFPWHGIYIPIGKIQFLPKLLRVFGGDYGFIKKLFFNFFIALRMPKKFLHNMRRKIS